MAGLLKEPWTHSCTFALDLRIDLPSFDEVMGLLQTPRPTDSLAIGRLTVQAPLGVARWGAQCAIYDGRGAVMLLRWAAWVALSVCFRCTTRAPFAVSDRLANVWGRWGERDLYFRCTYGSTQPQTYLSSGRLCGLLRTVSRFGIAELDLSFNALENRDMATVAAAISALPELRTLNLACNRIDIRIRVWQPCSHTTAPTCVL